LSTEGKGLHLDFHTTARTVLFGTLSAALLAVQAHAEEKEKEPLAIIEVGSAGEWSRSGGSSFGPSVAVEFEPIRNWLEIEIGTAPLFGNGRTESSNLRQEILWPVPAAVTTKE
jgi:hypothetical protein